MFRSPSNESSLDHSGCPQAPRGRTKPSRSSARTSSASPPGVPQEGPPRRPTRRLLFPRDQAATLRWADQKGTDSPDLYTSAAAGEKVFPLLLENQKEHPRGGCHLQDGGRSSRETGREARRTPPRKRACRRKGPRNAPAAMSAGHSPPSCVPRERPPFLRQRFQFFRDKAARGSCPTR